MDITKTITSSRTAAYEGIERHDVQLGIHSLGSKPYLGLDTETQTESYAQSLAVKLKRLTTSLELPRDALDLVLYEKMT